MRTFNYWDPRVLIEY